MNTNLLYCGSIVLTVCVEYEYEGNQQDCMMGGTHD